MQVRVFEGFTSGLQATEEFMVQVAASMVGAVILALFVSSGAVAGQAVKVQV